MCVCEGGLCVWVGVGVGVRGGFVGVGGCGGHCVCESFVCGGRGGIVCVCVGGGG